VQRHLGRKHVSPIDETECPEDDCDETFTSQDELLAHFAGQHEDWIGAASRIEVVSDKLQLKDFNIKYGNDFEDFMEKQVGGQRQDLNSMGYVTEDKTSLIAMHGNEVWGFAGVELRRE